MKDNRVLLVTGASSDIGSVLIRRVFKKYDKVWAHYHASNVMTESLRKELGKSIEPIQADFANADSTKRMIAAIEESGIIPNQIVHLTAPKACSMQFHKFSWENYQNEINTSLRSITMILQSFMPYMAKQRYGKVVFMLSAYLLGVPPKFQSPYITVKHALYGLMSSLAAEYAAKGVMVNAVSPDMMETKFLSQLPDLIKEQSAKNNPLGRNILVEEVVPTIEYLLSSGSDVITGQNIGVTGGVR